MNDVANAGKSAEAGKSAARVRGNPKDKGQIVLVLQGGGALGAYQVGVCQALSEAGIEPDWVIGTSIGAINAALIAGNEPGERFDRLREFWARVEHGPVARLFGSVPFIGAAMSNMLTIMQGIPAFFQPNVRSFTGVSVPLGAEAAGYYTTEPLARTLEELIDFGRINGGPTRLTVGAANVRTAEMLSLIHI